MKIKKIHHKFALLFITLIAAAVSVVGWIAFRQTERAVIAEAVLHMDNDLEEKLHRAEIFHAKAKTALNMALENPIFREYFSLPETQQGNKFDSKGVLTLTKAQWAARERLEQWTLSLQKKFPIAEACLVDRTGQEHLRITSGKITANADFSSNEASSPFFAPTFQLAPDQVHIAYPYMSPDVKKWVFAYTSPIVLADNSIPAFYHLEVPVALFQEVLIAKTKPSAGNANHELHRDPLGDRLFVVDPSGLVVADNVQTVSLNLKEKYKLDGDHKLSDYLPSLTSFSASHDFLNSMAQVTTEAHGQSHFEMNDQTFFLVFKRRPTTFGWSLVHIKSYAHLLDGVTSLATIKRTIFATSIVVILAALLAVWLLSSLITRPIKLIESAMRSLEAGDPILQVATTSEDELGHMVKVFNHMSAQIQKSHASLIKTKNKLTTIIFSAREGIVVTDDLGEVVLINPAAERLLGKTEEQVKAEGFLQLVDNPEYVTAFLAQEGANMPDILVYKNRVLKFHAATIREMDGTPIGSAALIRDVTEEKQLEEKLREYSYTDQLTGLYNRRFLEESLGKEFNRSKRYKQDLSLLFFDVDHFKKFNDTYGHEMGDKVLAAIGLQARDFFRSSDLCCRYGGEEFCIILSNTNAQNALIAAERFRKVIEQAPVESVGVTISIGVATTTSPGVDSASQLVKLADAALYEGKSAGRNCVILWDTVRK